MHAFSGFGHSPLDDGNKYELVRGELPGVAITSGRVRLSHSTGANGAVAHRFLDWSRATIERDHFVAAADQSMDHVAAHPAQANEAKLHEHYDTPSPARP